MTRLRRSFLALACGLSLISPGDAPGAPEHPMDRYNVVWDSPSTNYNGSMPIGNGDIGANVWVEPNGDLLFYLSKTDTWSGGDFRETTLLKLGRVRVTLDPPLYTHGATFKQELDLKSGAIRIEVSGVRCQVSGGSEEHADVLEGSEGVVAGFVDKAPDKVCDKGPASRRVQSHEDLKPETRNLKAGTRLLTFWIDANHPVVNVEIESSEPCTARVALESWRARNEFMERGARPDVIVPTDGQSIRWYQRNITSVYADRMKEQRLGHLLGQFEDPLINRTFGAVIAADGLKAADDQTMVSPSPVKRVQLRIHPLTAQTETAEQWLAMLDQQRAASDAVPVADAWMAHVAWWQDFWARSYIHVAGTPDAEQVAQAYQLQRWVQAGSGRGAYPIKFNGSIFTVDGLDIFWAEPEGVMRGPDYRRWEGLYWFQNTRLIYWPMLYSGDYDQMHPLFNMYREMLPLLKKRTQHYFDHDGVFFNETTQIWGLYANQSWKGGTTDNYAVSPYMRYYFDGGLELSAMMLDYYRYTQDDAFFAETLLPIADEVLIFYDQHYPRDANGKLHIAPSQVLETWHVAEDPTPALAALKTVLSGLLELPERLTTEAQRERWKRFRGEVKALPIREEEDGRRYVAPAYVFEQLKNCENPPLYTVFPYRIYMVGKPDLDVGRATFDRRRAPEMGGWQQTPIQAAMLGLTDIAQRDLVRNVKTRDPGWYKGPTDYRFPGFWGPYQDWIPNQCHAGVIMATLQRMLMVADGDAIYMLPAWPDDWKAEFKLHAPRRTVVEGRVENGKLLDLKVTPASRRRDVVVVKREM